MFMRNTFLLDILPCRGNMRFDNTLKSNIVKYDHAHFITSKRYLRFDKYLTRL